MKEPNPQAPEFIKKPFFFIFPSFTLFYVYAPNTNFRTPYCSTDSGEKVCNEQNTKQCKVEPFVFEFTLAFNDLPDMDPWGGMDIYCEIMDGNGYKGEVKFGDTVFGDDNTLGYTKILTSSQQEHWETDIETSNAQLTKRLILTKRVFKNYFTLPKPIKICCYDEDFGWDDSLGCITLDHDRLSKNINKPPIWQDYSKFEDSEIEHEAKLQILEKFTGGPSTGWFS